MYSNHEHKLTDVTSGIHTSLPVDSIGLLLKVDPTGKLQGYLTATRDTSGQHYKNSIVLQPITDELYLHLHECIEGLTKGFLINEMKERFWDE